MRLLLATTILLLTSLVLATVADGDRAYDAGDYQRAIAEYQEAFEQRSSNIQALYKLAKAKTALAGTLSGAEAERLYEAAAAHAREAIAAAPDEAEAHFELGRALGRLAQFKGILQSLNLAAEVKSSLERAIELKPDHSGAHHALALWHLEVPWIAGGRSAQVRPLFDRAIEIDPSAITHRVDYGEALIRLGDKDAAKALLEAALSLPALTAQDQQDHEKARQLLADL